MATKIGPKTVTQRDRSKNLVFCVDAAHGDSYGGQPFTQQIAALPSSSTLGAATWTNGIDFGHGLVGGRWHQESTSDALVRYLVASSWTPTSGDVMTFSCYVWVDVYKSSYFKSQIYVYVDGVRNWLQHDGSWTTGIHEQYHLIRPTVQAQWTRLSTTITFPSGTLTSFSWGGFYRTSSNWNMCIANMQLESGTTATRYSSTTRNASNSVKNISGVGAQGTTLTGTFATYGQQLHKPFPLGGRSAGTLGAIKATERPRNVNTTVDPNQGHIGGAYWDLDGSDEVIVTSYADGSELDLSRGTIVSWFKTSTTHNGCIVGWGTAGTDNYAEVAVTDDWTGSYADESFNFGRYAGSTTYIHKYIRKGAGFYADGNWHCVACVSHGGASDLGNIYIDGELESVSTLSNVGGGHPFMNLKPETQYLNIGRRPYNSGGTYFNGEIATVMIWGETLTAKEVKDIYIAQKGRFGK